MNILRLSYYEALIGKWKSTSKSTAQQVADTLIQVDEPKYLSYGGINMEKQDHGKPTSKKVEINPRKEDINKPQAWFDHDGIWIYNYLGALEEASEVAKNRGVSIEKVWPTEQEQLYFLNALPGDISAKNKVLYNGKFLRYRNAGNNTLSDHDVILYWWVAGSHDGDSARWVHLLPELFEARSSSANRGQSMPIRFFPEGI